ncbi:MAG: CotH kinase family protein [Eubacterium sp.]|nr:CotH kinase family protein [Eubacterium sp.]
MLKKVWKKALVATLAAGMIISASSVYQPVVSQAHGTGVEILEEDQLKNKPDPDYKINEAYQGKAKNAEYGKYFFKDKLQTVELTVDEDNLNYLFNRADQKPTVMADSVKIGDEEYGYVGLKTKGNYTLDHTYSDYVNSDRFSLSINFAKYINEENYGDDQTFHGCKKISFNNFFFDKSMLKEYFALKLMNEMGLPAPEYGLAKVYINGKYYGVYSMIENMDKSILKRYYKCGGQDLSEYLVKPMDTDLQYDEKMDKYLKEDGSFDFGKDLKVKSDGTVETSGVLEDQSKLWENDEETLADVQGELSRVFGWQKKLNLLSQGKDFEGKKIDVNSDQYLELLGQVIDVDEFTKYFAACSYLVQLDNMFVTFRNFGLYVDPAGKALLVPWDYDLSFGCLYPSTADATANFDIDCMHRNNIWGNNPMEEDFSYVNFPLFNVIYQNDSLMKKYHQYMGDCTKVATFGGTLSDGQVFEAGWFNTWAEKVKEDLFAAAGEKMADNAFYVNNSNQPADVKAAFPNINKIIAMRSAGVLAQLQGKGAKTSGYGCNLATLGNGSEGNNTCTGQMILAESSTGIYVEGDYSNNAQISRPPSLTAKKLTSSDPEYEEIKNAIGVSSDDQIVVYYMQDSSEPKDGYTMHLPVASNMDPNNVSVYSYTSEGVTHLDSSAEDRSVVAKSDSIRYVAVVNGKMAPYWIKYTLIGVGVLIVVGLLVLLLLRRRKTQK